MSSIGRQHSRASWSCPPGCEERTASARGGGSVRAAFDVLHARETLVAPLDEPMRVSSTSADFEHMVASLLNSCERNRAGDDHAAPPALPRLAMRFRNGRVPRARRRGRDQALPAPPSSKRAPLRATPQLLSIRARTRAGSPPRASSRRRQRGDSPHGGEESGEALSFTVRAASRRLPRRGSHTAASRRACVSSFSGAAATSTMPRIVISVSSRGGAGSTRPP